MIFLDKIIDYLLLLTIALSYIISLVLITYTTAEVFIKEDPYYNRYYYSLIPLGIAVGLSIYFVLVKAYADKR